MAAEGFADRAYQPDGSLTPRSRPGAVIHDAEAVVARAVRMARDGVVLTPDGREVALRVDTICVHGDTPGARRARRGAFARRCRAAGADVAPIGALAVKWWREADTDARRALMAGMFGWMLDAFDVMLFALVLPYVSADLGLTKAEGGVLGSVMLVAAAAGGVGFGWIADRFGRTRGLMLSVALYSVFTFACGFANSLAQFVVFRVFLGLGMGGVWTSGAALVSESWPSHSRGKALGFMQSGWAIGYAAAVLVSGFVQPRYGWRAVFFIGILPAFFTLWVQRRVKEPAIWTASSRAKAPSPGVPVDLPQRDRRADARADADEHLHAVRVVGLQSVASELSEVSLRRRGARASAAPRRPATCS